MRPLVLALLALAFAPASASATVIHFSVTLCACDYSSGQGDTYGIVVRGGPAEANRVSVEQVPHGILVRDSGAPIVGGACRRLSDSARFCHGVFEDGAEVYLGDRDDSARVADLGGFVFGGDGDDLLYAASGSYRLDGGAGADRLEAGPGAGSGVSYEGRTEGVTVRLNDLPDDGAAGEHDDIRGLVWSIDGGGGDDVLEAGPGGAYINGYGGNDAIRGGAGSERISGGDGDDNIDAGAGDDELDGGLGADVLGGGSGRDRVSYGRQSVDPLRVSIGDGPGDGAAGEGDDVLGDVEDLSGGEGDDVLVGSDGPNRLEGRSGSDTLIGHAGDDTFSDGAIGDLLDAGPGRDRVTASAGARVRLADGEADRLRCGKMAPEVDADNLDRLTSCAPSAYYASSRGPNRSGRMRMVLECETPSAVPCTGYLQVRRNGRVASRRFRFGPIEGRKAAVKIRIRGGRLRPGDCLGLLTVTARPDFASVTRILERNEVCRGGRS